MYMYTKRTGHYTKQQDFSNRQEINLKKEN